MQINPKSVQEIAEKNPTAEAFLMMLAARERNPRGGVLKFDEAKRQIREGGFQYVVQDLLSTFKELERLGAGTMKKGVFHWSTSAKELAHMAFNDKGKPLPTPRAQSVKPKLEVVPTSPPPASEEKKEVQAVAPGLRIHLPNRISVDVPENLSKDQHSVILSMLEKFA